MFILSQGLQIPKPRGRRRVTFPGGVPIVVAALAAALAGVLGITIAAPALAAVPGEAPYGTGICLTSCEVRETSGHGTWAGNWVGIGLSHHAYCTKHGAAAPMPATGYRADGFRDDATHGYILGKYGDTEDDLTAAAVFMIVGDSGAITATSAIKARAQTLLAEAARFEGPYTTSVTMLDEPTIGSPGRATVSVLAASGRAVPGAHISVRATNATLSSATLTADSTGLATVTFTPSARAVQIDAHGSGLPATRAALWKPQRAGYQTLVTADSLVSATAGSASYEATFPTFPLVVTKNAPRPAGTLSTFTVYDGDPAAGGTTIASKPMTADDHGRLVFPADDTTGLVHLEDREYWVVESDVPDGYQPVQAAVRARFDDAAGSFTAHFTNQAVPTVTTRVSSQTATVGDEIHDTYTVAGAAPGYTGPVRIEVYGPYAPDTDLTDQDICLSKRAGSWTERIDGDGTYTSPTFTVTAPGLYTYVEHLPGTRDQAAVSTACGLAEETTLVTAAQPAPTPTTSPTTAAPAPDTPASAGSLPFTGASAGVLATVAMTVLAVGGSLIAARRYGH